MIFRSATSLATAVVTAGVLAGCSFGQPDDGEAGQPPRLPTPSPSSTGPPGETAPQVILTNLSVPWGLAFLPDRSALITERDTRRILRVKPDLTVERVQTVQEAHASGEGGLMGIAVSPNYERDQTVFIYYTTRDDNRIARLTLGGAPRPIVTGIPQSGIHNGGRLAFGPDGFLYASTGDGSESGLAQNLGSLGGKILRMTGDGQPAPGNPFGTLVWSYGHRNVQGFAWDAGKRLYASEFGANRWDEINLIEPGKNYGWPVVEGTGRDARFVNPLATFPTSESSCSGAAISGETFVTACLRGRRVYLARLSASGTIVGAPAAALVGHYGRLRTVERAPDGSLWLTTSNHDGRGEPGPEDDRVIRIVVTGAGAVGKS